MSCQQVFWTLEKWPKFGTPANPLTKDPTLHLEGRFAALHLEACVAHAAAFSFYWHWYSSSPPDFTVLERSLIYVVVGWSTLAGWLMQCLTFGWADEGRKSWAAEHFHGDRYWKRVNWSLIHSQKWLKTKPSHFSVVFQQVLLFIFLPLPLISSFVHFVRLFFCFDTSAHTLCFQDGECGDLLWRLVGVGENEEGKAESQQQEAGAQSGPSSRGWWGGGSGRAEAGGRRGPTHGGSHAQVLFWWKVGVFGSPVLSTLPQCQPMVVPPRSPPSEEWDLEAGSSLANPGVLVLGLIPVLGEMVAFPITFNSFPPSCPGKERGEEQEGKKEEAKFRSPLLPSWSSNYLHAIQALPSAMGLTGAQPLEAECEITTVGQEKGWSHTERPGFSPRRGAGVIWWCRRWSAGDEALCRGSLSPPWPEREWSLWLHSPHLLWVISLEQEGSEFLRCWTVGAPGAPVEATFVWCLCKSSSELNWGAVRGSAHLKSPAPSCAAALCWKSWWRCRSQDLNACLCRDRPALLLVLPVSDAGRSNVSPACWSSLPSHYVSRHRVLFFWSQVNTIWSSFDKTSLSAGQSWFYLYVLFFD